MIRALLALVLRVFFRRVEVAGEERVPKDAPVIFVLNHPNALVDPLFLLALSDRRVSFLAKAPLFDMPVIGLLARALRALPVYRKVEGPDTSRNLETFRRARDILQEGGAIAIFPEGTTHSEPRLKPIKTGAARIALGTGIALTVIPAGLYYTQKGIFRSEALLYYGDPIRVEPVAQAEEPPREAVQALSTRIQEALLDVTLNADDHASLALVALAERVFSEGGTLLDELEVRRRMVEGYAYHVARNRERIHALERRLRRYQADLAQAGLSPEGLLEPGAVLRDAARAAAAFLVLLPFALVGAVLNWPTYRLVGTIATRVSRTDDTVPATAKILGSLLFFPLTWCVFAAVIGARFGGSAGVLALLVQPLLAWAALHLMEGLERFGAALRALGCWLRRRDLYDRLRVERGAIRREIEDLGAAP